MVCAVWLAPISRQVEDLEQQTHQLPGLAVEQEMFPFAETASRH